MTLRSLVNYVIAGSFGLSIGMTHESINQVLDLKGITVGGRYVTPAVPTGTPDQVTVSIEGGKATLGLQSTGILVKKSLTSKAFNYPISNTEPSRAFTNEGAIAQVILTLPVCAPGLEYTAIVQNTNGLRLTAQGGATIKMGSQSGTLVESQIVGSSLTLLGINETTWVAVRGLGTWTVN